MKSFVLQEHFWNLDKTEFRIPPKLMIQIWDNDKFSLDDYLGENTASQHVCNTVYVVCSVYVLSLFFKFCPIFVAGSLELDLLHLIPPARTPEKCSLKMLPGDTGSKKHRPKKAPSLFSQKSARGWWPCFMEQDGKRVLTVCSCLQISSLNQFVNAFNMYLKL